MRRPKALNIGIGEMKSASTKCLSCGRGMTVNEHGFLDCASCRASTLSPGLTAAKAASPSKTRASKDAAHNVWNVLKLFWPDLIALLAIALCTILLGEMLLDMIRRHL